ncbi:hypothetical protein BASA83_010461 [Batrachochytrium salamandrivorans]|nr:hypothetical protein BASA83_010461 [Batrachochytrium salamandrivorans]
MTTAQALHEAASAVYSHLSLTPISQVLRHMHRSRGIKPLISVHEDTELGLSLTIMRNANILAIPVYRIPKAEPTGKVFTGIVSVFDILANTVFQQVFDSMCVDKSQPPLMERDEFQRYTKIMEEEKAFFTTKIGDLVGKTRESSESWILHSYDPLSSLLQILTCDNRHRALIVDDEAISASASNTDDGYGPTAPPSGSLFALSRRPIYSALEGFRTLYIHRVPAVAVVEDTGRLVANLSASDLPTSMIVDIIHRMWVVDGEDHPIGVLSMSDILSVFVPEDGAAIQQ